MGDLINLLTTSDIIQAVGIIVATATAIASIIISVVTLRQNSKMIEEESRPYICIYGSIVNVQSTHYYVIIKNFGKSGAIITSLSCDHDLRDVVHDPGNRRIDPFGHISGTFFAPGQSLYFPSKSPFPEDISQLTFELSYRWGRKSYKERCVLNTDAHADLISVRASSKDKELKIMSYALQDLLEKNL